MRVEASEGGEEAFAHSIWGEASLKDGETDCRHSHPW